MEEDEKKVEVPVSAAGGVGVGASAPAYSKMEEEMQELERLGGKEIKVVKNGKFVFKHGKVEWRKISRNLCGTRKWQSWQLSTYSCLREFQKAIPVKKYLESLILSLLNPTNASILIVDGTVISPSPGWKLSIIFVKKINILIWQRFIRIRFYSWRMGTWFIESSWYLWWW